jgi:alcohol dehydrogenase class IV
MPKRLRDIGIKKEDIPRFVDTLFTPVNMRFVTNNPRLCSREDAAKILEQAW